MFDLVAGVRRGLPSALGALILLAAVGLAACRATPSATSTLVPTATPTPAATAVLEGTPTATRTVPTATLRPGGLTPVDRRQIDGPTPDPAWIAVLSEGFERSAHGWSMGRDTNARATVRRDIDEVYRWNVEAREPVHWYVLPDVYTVSDLYLTVEARRVQGPADAAYGVVLRLADEGNYYAFLVSEVYGFKIVRKRDASWVTIKDWTPTTALRSNETNRLTVVAEQDVFHLYVNDEAVLDVSQRGRGNVRV